MEEMEEAAAAVPVVMAARVAIAVMVMPAAVAMPVEVVRVEDSRGSDSRSRRC